MDVVPKLEVTANIKRCSSSSVIDLHVNKFSLICPKNCREFGRITSAPFLMGENIGLNSEWQIYVEGMDGNVGCFIELTSSPLNKQYLAKGIRIKFAMGLGSSRNRFLCKCGQYEPIEGLFTTENLKCGYKSLGEIFDLYKKSRTHLENNVLRICVEMEIEADGDTEDEKIIKIMSLNRLQKLSHDLGQLLVVVTPKPNSLGFEGHQKYSDVIIKCVDTTFACHKLILAARSAVFSVMLDTNMAETVKNEIIINDMTPATLSALLHYIYSGTVEPPVSSTCDPLSPPPPSYTWIELLDGAEKYDLPQLKEFCFDKILETISQENLVVVAIAMQRYGANMERRKLVHKFCVENFTSLIKNPSFQQILLTNPGALFGMDEPILPISTKQSQPKEEGEEVQKSEPMEGQEVQKSEPLEGQEVQKSEPMEGQEVQKSEPMEGQEVQKSEPMEGQEVQKSEPIEVAADTADPVPIAAAAPIATIAADPPEPIASPEPILVPMEPPTGPESPL